MKDVMLAESPIEERAQVLHDSCDQIEEKQYTIRMNWFKDVLNYRKQRSS
jgi:hypothetical protein